MELRSGFPRLPWEQKYASSNLASAMRRETFFSRKKPSLSVGDDLLWYEVRLPGRDRGRITSIVSSSLISLIQLDRKQRLSKKVVLLVRVQPEASQARL